MINVFIIDDEKAISEIIQFFIEDENLPMVIRGIAYDGREGEKLLVNKKPHIVFIDIQMPYFNGLSLMEKYPWHKYIIVSAFNYFEYAQEAIQLGAYDYLLKPIDKDKLIEAIERVFHSKIYKDDCVNQVISYLNDNYKKQFKIMDLAEKLGYNHSYLSRRFKEVTGMTILDKLNLIRLKLAEDLLLKTNLTIKEISNIVGFSSLKYFHKVFKDNNSITPQGFRNEIR